MKKYIVVDNFFNEPDSFRNFALQQKFYDKDNHPHDGLDAFPGKRTDYFNDTNSQFFLIAQGPTFELNTKKLLAVQMNFN